MNSTTKATCGAATRSGKACGNVAGYKTDHLGFGCCHLHGGSTPNHRKAAGVEIARRECAVLGVPVETSPAEALIHEVWEAAGNVEFYRGLVQALPTHPEPDVLVDEGRGPRWERGDPGLYARTYHVSGLPTGEAKPHFLLTLYNDERKRLVDACAAALRAGVEERQLRIAEADAARITAAFSVAFEGMGLIGRIEEFRGRFNDALAECVQSAHLGATSTS